MARRQTFYLPVMIAATVAAACLVALLAASEEAEATFPGENGRIAYASYDAPFSKGDSEIYTINARGEGSPESPTMRSPTSSLGVVVRSGSFPE